LNNMYSVLLGLFKRRDDVELLCNTNNRTSDLVTLFALPFSYQSKDQKHIRTNGLHKKPT